MKWDVIFIIIIVIITAGLLVFNYWWLPKQENQNQGTAIPVGYASYHDQDYNYSMFYPEGWKTDSLEADLMTGDVEHFRIFAPSLPEYDRSGNLITIMVYNYAFTIEDVRKREAKEAKEKSQLLEIREVEIGNQKGYETTRFYESSNRKLMAIDIPLNGKTYYMTYWAKVDFYNNYCKTIINSFAIKK